MSASTLSCSVQSTDTGFLKEAVAVYTQHQIEALCKRKEDVEILELNIQPDHVHLVVSLAPKYAVSEFMGYLKG
jgi:putative transposase